jgi:hypothetical protein
VRGPRRRDRRAGQTGAAADAEWAALVDCVQIAFAPFPVTVADVPPAAGTFTEAIIAGSRADAWFDATILSIASNEGSCAPQDDGIAFVFANHFTPAGRAVRIL